MHSRVLVSSSGVVALTFSLRGKFQNLSKRRAQRLCKEWRALFGAWRSFLWVLATSPLTKISSFSDVGCL